MHIKLIISLCALCAAALTPSADLSAESTTESKSKAEAARFDPIIKNIEGWQVHIEPKLLDAEQYPQGAKALKMLANHLQRIAILLPAQKLKKMRTLEIWIESNHSLANMQYHPSIKWLKQHGHDPRLKKKVHIPRAKSLLQRSQMLKHPAVILHELAHSYHDQYLGFDDPRIIMAYDAAMAAGIYDKALLFNGNTVRHYGATNHKEYFAEGTEAYFYRNDFYPFVAAELKKHDPAFYKLLSEIWGSLN
ncbi:MAG: metallopeptidase [Lentimonas sp.]